TCSMYSSLTFVNSSKRISTAAPNSGFNCGSFSVTMDIIAPSANAVDNDLLNTGESPMSIPNISSAMSTTKQLNPGASEYLLNTGQTGCSLNAVQPIVTNQSPDEPTAAGDNIRPNQSPLNV